MIRLLDGLIAGCLLLAVAYYAGAVVRAMCDEIGKRIKGRK